MAHPLKPQLEWPIATFECKTPLRSAAIPAFKGPNLWGTQLNHRRQALPAHCILTQRSSSRRDSFLLAPAILQHLPDGHIQQHTQALRQNTPCVDAAKVSRSILHTPERKNRAASVRQATHSSMQKNYAAGFSARCWAATSCQRMLAFMHKWRASIIGGIRNQ